MEFLRRLFGTDSQGSAREAPSRRASHVTPSRTQRVNMPIREESPPAIPEPESDIETSTGPETAAEAVAEPLEEHGYDPAPRPEGARTVESAPGEASRRSVAKENVKDIVAPLCRPEFRRRRQC